VRLQRAAGASERLFELLDAVPEIRALRDRMDAGIESVRVSAVRAAQEAARQAREATQAQEADPLISTQAQ
jgi:hypothetical protein